MNPCCRRAILAERRVIRESIRSGIAVCKSVGLDPTALSFAADLGVLEREWRLADERREKRGRKRS